MEKNSKKRTFSKYKQLKKAILYVSKKDSFIQMKKKYSFKNLLTLIFILLLFLQIILSKITFQKLRNLDSNSEIKLRVKGEGNISILYDSFNPLPSLILVDDVQNPSSRNIYKSIIGEYEVIMRFDSPITSCEKMFYSLRSIVEIDFSNFDITNIQNMDNMFFGCSNLESINFRNFDTSSVTSMGHLFENCYKLKSLDLSKFNTSKTENMIRMFYNCNSLIFLEVSSFDTSSVNTMNSMFYKCYQLTSLNLLNFNTSLVKSMYDMFYGCTELLYLDLSKFSTSAVTTMKGMFRECKKLKELNLENFITSTVKEMNEMFKDCNSLISLNVSNFNTQSVENMQYMFSGCKNLKSLDLSNFNTESVKQMDNMFSYCSSLIYLNLISFKMDSIIKKDNMFNEIALSKFCANDNNLKEELQSRDINNSCEDSCFALNNIKIIPEKSICIAKCYYDSEYIFEYNNICYKKCPECTSNSTTDDYLCEKICNEECIYKFSSFCIKKADSAQESDSTNGPETDKLIEQETDKKTELESYNLNEPETDKKTELESYNLNGPEADESTEKETDKSTEKETDKATEKETDKTTEQETDKPSEQETDKATEKETDKTTEKGTDKISEQETDKISEQETNKSTEQETDKVSEQETDKTTEKERDKTTEQEIDKITEQEIDKASETSKIEKESDRNTYNEIKITVPKINESELIINCGAKDLFIGKSCGTEISSPTNKDQLIYNIQNDIMNHKIDNLLDNITKTKEDLVIQEKDTIYQITTTENQNSNEYKNISTVNLGDCEDRLKDIYKIDKSLPLIIFKIDYYSPGLLIPVIGYEIFHPVNKSKLDLNYCKDILIELNIPVSIDEDNIFKHDPNSEYYQDECVPSTSENGTDIILNDRQNEFNNYNLSLCQNNCTFTGYDTETKKALCDCEVKTKINLISEIIEDKNILSSNFTSNDGSSSNVVTMKCVYTLFTKDGLKTNIGSYILIFIIVLFSISSIFMYKVGYVMLENDIKAIIFEKEKENDISENNNPDIYKYQKKSSKKKKIKKKPKNRRKIKSKSDLNEPPKKKNITKAKSKKLNSSKGIDILSQTNLKLKDVKVLFNFQKKKNTKKLNTIKNNKITIGKPIFMNKINLNMNDYEINSLSYEEALKYDKRTYPQYYISLIKTKHPIFFSFIPIKDYNTMIIKICLFFLSFCIYYAVNALFFNDSTIHRLYEDGGSYNIVYFLPQIIYSFIISHFLSTLLKYIFVSERNIIEIKKEQLLETAKNKVDKVKRELTIKYIIFYVSGILFLIFFWYYLSSFCAVYQNSQVILIENTFLSFLVSLLYPFIINTLPGFFRIHSLSNNTKEIFYRISRFIQIL